MSKKSKKAKSPKGRGRGAKGDSISGLYMELDETRFDSDKTYSLIESAQANALKERGGRDYIVENGGSANIEFEFGNNSIIRTIRVVGETANGSNDYSVRLAFLGNFEYAKTGKLLGGKVNELTCWTYGTHWTGDSVIDWGTIDKANALMGSTIWDLSPYPDTSDRVYEYDRYNLDNGYPSSRRDDFQDFASSRFFADSWWQDPFAPNLI